MSTFIISLADTSAGLSQLEGKGASLADLTAAELPVPDGFHITTAAYELFEVTCANEHAFACSGNGYIEQAPLTL